MAKIQMTILALILTIFAVSGCSDGETQTRSMEQIYAEEGVPVRVEEVTPQAFVQEKEYTAVLSGIIESSEFAMIADRIDKINAKVGDYVEKNAVIIEFPTDNPTANYYQAKVQFENAQARFNRMKQYFETGGLSQQAYDDAEASFRVAEANWDAVKQSVLVRAPFSGVLTQLNVRESDNVEKEDKLFTVSRTDRLKAQVWIPDTEIENISVGLPAHAKWQGRELTGKIVQVDRSADVHRRAFGAIVEFDNPSSLLPSGTTADININVYSNDAAIVTERKNIMSDEFGPYVFIVKGNKAEKHYVTLGKTSLLSVEVLEGLSAGDTLITEGQMQLESGALVKIISDPTAHASVDNSTGNENSDH
ncbi:MAG: efflux RND transporter periplasmic adaptor subunit [Candidatus Zixiibacteriota bacterium]